MEGKLRIKRVPFSNFLLWLQSVQIPPHKFGCKGSKNFLSRNTFLWLGATRDFAPLYIIYGILPLLTPANSEY